MPPGPVAARNTAPRVPSPLRGLSPGVLTARVVRHSRLYGLKTPPRRAQTSADERKARVGHGAKTAAVREQAILALLSEPTIVAAAARVDMGESTLRRWLTEDAAFQAEFEMARHATFKAALHRIPALTARAVDTLAALLGDKEPPTVRLGAARTVVEVGLHQHDAETILKKLDAIEARQPRR